VSYLTTPPRSPWLELSVDTYLDRRHRNWVLAEGLGDVVFISERGVVLVHRKRAEGIAAALLGGRDVLMLEDALALPAKTPPEPARRPAPPPADPARVKQSLSADTRTSRWRDIWGWLAIMAGVAVLVTALAVPLDDAGLARSAGSGGGPRWDGGAGAGQGQLSGIRRPPRSTSAAASAGRRSRPDRYHRRAAGREDVPGRPCTSWAGSRDGTYCWKSGWR
jgi:hypothetical protein